MYSPSPVPEPGCFVVKNGVKSRERVLSQMPGPVSSISIATPPSQSRVRTRIQGLSDAAQASAAFDLGGTREVRCCQAKAGVDDLRHVERFLRKLGSSSCRDQIANQVANAARALEGVGEQLVEQADSPRLLEHSLGADDRLRRV